MARIFISYSRTDRPHAQQLAAALEARGHNVWWDRELLAGDAFRSTISHELKASDVCIVLWSPAAVGSKWVLDEADLASADEKLMPVTFNAQVEAPIGFGQIHVQNLSAWSGQDKSPEMEEADRTIDAILQGRFQSALMQIGKRVRVGDNAGSAVALVARVAGTIGGLPLTRLFGGAFAVGAIIGIAQAIGVLFVGGDPINKLLSIPAYALVVVLARAAHQFVILRKGQSSRRFFDESFEFWLILSALVIAGLMALGSIVLGDLTPREVVQHGPGAILAVLAVITATRLTLSALRLALRA
ncbi:MAG: toll/interleukin-1 receptor domain-containing protein [Hyphomonadaceae bacterium]|nr:toll/interleukin-1 receptor domain-containing protein [Hyphomonadaceae bacterium]